MAESQNENIPGFMSRISAAVASIGDRVSAFGDQSARIKKLEDDLALSVTARQEAEAAAASQKAAAHKAQSDLTAEQTAHNNTRVDLAAANKKIEDQGKLLSDPKFAGNVLATQQLSKLGAAPVPESNAGSGKQDFSHLKGIDRAKAAHRASYQTK